MEDENVYKHLKKRCVDANLNIKSLCEKAGIARSTVQRWKTKEPHTIIVFRKLLAILEAHTKK